MPNEPAPSAENGHPRNRQDAESGRGTGKTRTNEMPTLPGLTGTFSTILIDPPWRFDNRTGKVAPEHRRLRRRVARPNGLGRAATRTFSVTAHRCSPCDTP